MAFPSLASIFGGSPAPMVGAPPVATANPSQVAQPGVALPGTQSSPQTAPNGLVPTQPVVEVTPFDTFKDIWQTPSNTGTDPNAPMFAGVDPKKLMESAGKVDFAKIISPESLAAISAGGEGATKAFAAAMNSVAQSVYAQSAFATTKIVDEAMTRQRDQFNTNLPSLITSHTANASLVKSNPLLSNPAVTPLVDALRETLIRKNPNATSEEITGQVTDYFNALGTSFAPKASVDPATARAAKSEDWSSFLS